MTPATLYQTPPSDFIPKVEIASCWIRCAGLYLLLERPDSGREGARWGNPGGKLDAGEYPQEAVIREVLEETALVLLPDELIDLGVIFVRKPGWDYICNLFFYDLVTPTEVRLSAEHKSYQWCSLSTARQLPLLSGIAETMAEFERRLISQKGMAA